MFFLSTSFKFLLYRFGFPPSFIFIYLFIFFECKLNFKRLENYFVVRYNVVRWWRLQNMQFYLLTLYNCRLRRINLWSSVIFIYHWIVSTLRALFRRVPASNQQSNISQKFIFWYCWITVYNFSFYRYFSFFIYRLLKQICINMCSTLTDKSIKLF